MKTKQGFDYGPGALIVLVVSIGFAAVVYGVNMLSFDFFNIPAWIFCPLGVYTLLYAVIARKDPIYHLAWGTVMFTVGIVSAFYKIVNALVVLGILLIVIAVIGTVAYWRSKK